MNDLRETYDRLKDAPGGCPSAETIRRHAEGLLEGTEARQVAFHLSDCAACVALLERLDPVDPPELPETLREEMTGKIGRRLGFDIAPPEAPGRIGRLLRFRVPVLVPAAIAAVALALFWWVGGDSRHAVDVTSPVRHLEVFTIDNSVGRAGEDEAERPQALVGVGEPFVLELYLDRLDLRPGERLRFAVTDDAGSPVAEGDTPLLEDYNIRLALSFARPGRHTLVLFDPGGGELARTDMAVRR